MIKIFKMANGEDIIGTVENKPHWRDSVHKITDPYYIIEIQDEYGRVVTKLSNLLALSDDTMIEIDKDQIITSFNAKNIIVEYYNKVKVLRSSDKLEQKVVDAIQELDSINNEDNELDNMLIFDKSKMN